MKLLEIYRAVLKYCGMEADDKGFITMRIDDKSEPAFIDGMRMVLPTDQQLRNVNPKESIVFHPLAENILRGESEVIQKLKTIINIRLNVTVGILGQTLLNLVASPAQHSKLDTEQAELLVAVSDADEKSVTNFVNVMLAGVKSTPERIFTNIYLKRGGTHREKRYSRVGIVTFPFYTNLLEGKVDKIRVKDVETYKQLMQFIFPNIADSEEYNFGSDSHVAPYLEALLRSSANVATRLNDLITMFKDYIDEPDQLMFDSEWFEYFQDLNALTSEIRKVPVQQGSEGSVGREEAPAAAPAPMMVAPAPMTAPAMGQPYPTVGAPAARPEVKQTKRGLDFKSIVANNPGMAMAPNPMMPHAMNQWQMQQMQQQQRPPSWAAPQMPQVPLPPGAQMTPQGPMIMTPQGPAPIALVQTPQGPMWQMVPPQMPPMGMAPGYPQGGFAPNPTWAYPNNGYGR